MIDAPEDAFVGSFLSCSYRQNTFSITRLENGSRQQKAPNKAEVESASSSSFASPYALLNVLQSLLPLSETLTEKIDRLWSHLAAACTEQGLDRQATQGSS